ncbi:Lyzozyme M1 (1,4-beta-N-acetylmuramidase), GH25 family [Eubacterium uniforme]|uniref:Lyzozyme M1 (1,4-beta-N-acetylmuramidase), GH25 family n=1 Tax=Eubacterium uniforme TaxID=39495 RepID=A0A1T4VJ17_9FIRM|nr:glycoside hydrolase family 25 protein [Eubacterium uniforme]SKA64581.1 Lyzozyme M1 (1,4-beta-N-acetylmuramidase), GH25 family [Eubacterium uniforme]
MRKEFVGKRYRDKLIAMSLAILVLGSSCLGCSKKSDVERRRQSENETFDETETTDYLYDEPESLGRSMTYADGSLIFHHMHVDEAAIPIEYDLDKFIKVDGKMTYEDEKYTYKLGVDVSKYQEKVKWDKVEKEGYEFAMIRLGYRGYTEGEIFLDEKYEYNIKAANRSGLDVGVYFFSQAITEDEAIEEANFVLEHVKDQELGMPIVYDPEIVYNDKSRTKGISKEQFTKNTLAFCNTIADAGYEVMIYANMLWEDQQLNMSEIMKYDIWYADYVGLPQTPYHFSMWQYTDKGTVDGIKGGADINIQLIEK